jgi:hypothetical protein
VVAGVGVKGRGLMEGGGEREGDWEWEMAE